MSGQLSDKAKRFKKVFTTPGLFQGALLMKVPLLTFTGVSVQELSLERAEVSLPFGWLTKNPFGSMYFGAIMMASEAASGATMLLHTEDYPKKVSPIVARIEGEFLRAAYSRMTFTCEDGDAIGQLIEKSDETGERQEETVVIEGHTEQGELTSRVELDWSVRVK
jgi:acyl-coenzyme A thioesterase PaaI-like protein